MGYKFRNFSKARRSPADVAMGLLDKGNIVLFRNQLGTISAELTTGRRTTITDHMTITEALAALDAKVNKSGDYAR